MPSLLSPTTTQPVAPPPIYEEPVAPVAAAPPPVEQAPVAPQQPPVDSGSAASAVGATVSQIPGAILSTPKKAVEVAQATPGALTEFTGVGRDAPTYRPAPTEGGIGEGREPLYASIDEARAGSDAAAQKVMQGDIGNIGNVLGSIKDVGLAHLAANKGEISPERANQTRWVTERLRDELTTGDPWASKPDADQIERLSWDTYFSRGDYTDWARANPELFLQSLEEGYTTPENYVWSPGLDAPWEVFQSGRSGAGRALADIGMSPVGAVGDAASALLTLGGASLAKEGAEQAARYGARTATKQFTGQAMQAGGRVLDAGLTMGLSEAVPGTFKVLGAGYNKLPWVGKQTADAAAGQVSDAAQTTGTQILSARRSAEGQPGVPTLEPPSFIGNPTGDPTIARVAMPDDGAGPIDITYHLDADGKLDGVYDVAMPGPLDRYRSLTDADAQAIYDAWGRLPESDRKTLRQAAYPALTRTETSPGEPFIESAAERVFDDAGNLVADTGRVGAGYQREVEDLRRSILRDARPERIVTDFTGSWEKTLYDGTLHPLTRRSLAEHRLQTLRDTLDALPASYRTPEIERHYRAMRDLLPKDPPAMGTGLKWRGPVTGRGGGLVPATARETTWLKDLAALPPDQFTRTRLNAGRVGGRNNVQLIFDRKPPMGASQAFHNGYTNYLDVQDFRLKNPPTMRKELAQLKSEVNGLRLAPTPAAQAREDAIKEALERSGIIPGASMMDADALVIAIESHLRTTRPTLPPLPGIVPAAPTGVYPVGSQSERWGMALDPDFERELDATVEIGGVSRTLGEIVQTHWKETATAQEIAKRQARGIPLDPADGRALTTTITKIATRFPGEYSKLTAAQLAEMRPEQLDRLAAALLKSDVQISQGVRSSTGKMLTPAEKKGVLGRMLNQYDDFIGKWRSAVLYNIGRGLQYPALQAAGNAVSGLVVLKSNPRALAMYLRPSQWGRSLAYLRDAESARVPSIIDHLERAGMGRMSNLGRVSRDQIGARTGFNQETSHPMTRALGMVLGNQYIKDVADTFDLRWRHAAMESIWEPGYARLKKDLVPMTEKTFTDFAASRGVPIGLTRPQIESALASLSAATGRYFDQPQLRAALYEAAGGSAAPNSRAVMDAADRVARDYHHELRQLTELANNEVNRLAFSGGDSNLEQLLQRGFVFTWWLSRATRLYATEASKSPLQMALWARAIDAGNQREKEGTDGRYKFFREFMQTPAGYTASLNEFSVLGTYLFGTSADPSDPRQVLTKLGELQSGGFAGDNLILSPMLHAAAFITGALGQDARTPDAFGVNRLEREIVDALNTVNQNLITFSKTREGNPSHIPYPGVSQGVINFLAQHLSGKIQGTQQVAGYDPSAGQASQIAAAATQIVMRDNPDLDPANPIDADRIERGVNEAMANPDSAIYQEAQSLYVDSLYLGPGSTGEGGWRDVVGGVLSHFVLPTQFSRQPTLGVERNQRRGRDVLRDDLGAASNLTPEMESTELDNALGALRSRSPEGRELQLIEDRAAGDPQTRVVRDLSNAIKYDGSAELAATLQELGQTSLPVDGYIFTAEQIASLPAEDRRALAERWIDASGNRATMSAYYENKDAQLRADKAYADAQALSEYAAQYPGGVDRFVDDTANVNPNYKRFIEGSVLIGGVQKSLPELRVTDHAEWVKQVTQYDQARTVIAGVKDSRYGLDIDPRYAGLVAGITEPVGTWLVRQNEEEAAEGGSDFAQLLQGGYDQFAALAPELDALDTAWGRPVGTTRALFVQGAINGGLDDAGDKNYALPKAEHDWLKAKGVSDYFESNYALKRYFEWQVAQPAGVDTSIDAYNQSYFSTRNQERVAELAMLFATGQAPTVDAVTGMPVVQDPMTGITVSNGAVVPGVRPGPSRLARDTVLAEEPGGRTGIRAVAGSPVMTAQMVSGSDGSLWVWADLGGGVGGWIDATNLQPAA